MVLSICRYVVSQLYVTSMLSGYSDEKITAIHEVETQTPGAAMSLALESV